MFPQIYTKFGKRYKKLERHEIIQEGAMMSVCNGELHPITNSDGKTVGSTPSQYSNERDFYNPIDDEDVISITPENLLNASHRSKYCNSRYLQYKGVLTTEEAKERMKQSHDLVVFQMDHISFSVMIIVSEFM